MTERERLIAKAEEDLFMQDPVMGKLVSAQRPIIHKPRGNYFTSLCRSIIGQQVSVKAASTIFRRFELITKMEPLVIVSLNDDQIKEIGLSRQKVSYLRDLAEHFAKDPKVYNHLGELSDEEVISELTAVKGIGVWTAQMFLMFTLVRLDVFAPDDVGIQNAMKRLYAWKEVPPKAELEALAEAWKPYRTIACWHLWQSLNNGP